MLREAGRRPGANLAGKVGQHGRSDITKINTLLLFTMATDGEIDIRGQYVPAGNLSNLSDLTGSYRSSKVRKADGRSPPVGPPSDSLDVRTRQFRGRNACAGSSLLGSPGSFSAYRMRSFFSRHHHLPKPELTETGAARTQVFEDLSQRATFVPTLTGRDPPPV
jgi:hypothetical protein